jgi:hypothetical protein
VNRSSFRRGTERFESIRLGDRKRGMDDCVLNARRFAHFMSTVQPFTLPQKCDEHGEMYRAERVGIDLGLQCSFERRDGPRTKFGWR